MEEIKNGKRFRYLSGVIKYLNYIKKSTNEEDILKFEIKFNGHYYFLEYEYRW